MVEVGDFARVRRVADVEDAEAGGSEPDDGERRIEGVVDVVVRGARAAKVAWATVLELDLWDIGDGVELEYIDGGGERVITIASWTAVSRHTGRSVPVRMVEIVIVRDGRIKELRAYYEDTVPLIEAADGVKGKYNPGVG